MAVTTGSLVLSGVSWGEYRRIARGFAGRRLRITYDRGDLEIMSPLYAHEKPAHRLEWLLLEWHRTRRIPIAAAGSTTFRHRRARRGVEPDNCYYIAHAAAVEHLRRIDLDIHPPPDLVLEVDETRRSIPKLPIYRALGVPEVWRLFRGRLTCRVLRKGRYVVSEMSEQVPGLRPADLESYLTAMTSDTMYDILEQFAAWCRTQP